MLPPFGQFRWEDKVTATKIRGSSTLTKTLLRRGHMSGLIVLNSIGLREWINNANFHCSFLCCHGDML